MPTIEIASIKSARLGLNQGDFDVAVIEESKLKSHRGLFYEHLIKQKGIIIHIGNPEKKDNKNGFFYADAIVDWSFDGDNIDHTNLTSDNPEDYAQTKFKFLESFRADIDKLLKIALESSPIKKIYFLTDYQFGPKNGKIEIGFNINDFWKQHDNGGIDFNTLYEINYTKTAHNIGLLKAGFD